jgi:type IV pilus assembly protein PilV
MLTLTNLHAQRGSTMLEVLITMVILAVGLLGLAGLQSRLQVSEMEAYQRAQALILLNDMANRIATNRNAAATYVTSAVGVGVGMICPTSTATQKDRDAMEWCNALQGAAETTGAGNVAGVMVGAMIGGRGCVESIGANKYMITVAWQGAVALSAPPAEVSCGANLYDTAGTQCAGDLCRRVVTTVVQIATLQ